MFDLWYAMPPLARALIGLVLLGIAAMLFFVPGGARIAIPIGALGMVSLFFCGAGHDNNGYHF